MTNFKFESEEIEDPELVSEFSMEDYEKYRLKTSELTIDLSIISLEGRDKEKYIEGRKEELNDSRTDVPHPYKPEKQSGKKEKDLVEFEGEPAYGKGFTDPEYNLIPENGDEIIRYEYNIKWISFVDHEKLVEVEIYTPTDSKISREKIVEIMNSFKLESDSTA